MVGAGVHTAPQGTSRSYKPQGNPEPEHEGPGDPHAPQAQSLRGLKNSVIEINTIQHSWYPEILDQDSNPSHSGENTRPLTARPPGSSISAVSEHMSAKMRTDGNSVSCGWESETVQPLGRTVRSFLHKLKTLLPEDPAAPLPGVTPPN